MWQDVIAPIPVADHVLLGGDRGEVGEHGDGVQDEGEAEEDDEGEEEGAVAAPDPQQRQHRGHRAHAPHHHQLHLLVAAQAVAITGPRPGLIKDTLTISLLKYLQCKLNLKDT